MFQPQIDLIPDRDMIRGVTVPVDLDGNPLPFGADPLRVRAIYMHPNDITAMIAEPDDECLA